MNDNNTDLTVSLLNRDTRSLKMRIKRIVANIETSDIDKADTFYHDVLGLEQVMDHGWLRTYG
jgi:lactoylglutathione lyase